MLSNLFKRADRSPPALPDGHRIYAIGDIHGRLDLLTALLDHIETDIGSYAGETTLVFLGDYIDRGPDSAGVVARLIVGPGPGTDWVFLKGNHDDFIVKLLEADEVSPRGFSAWLDQGGIDAMMSWGLSRSLIGSEDREEVIAALREAMPPAHIDFFTSLDLSYEVGDYMFVHAGVRPHVDLAEQKAADLLWIRDDFLTHRKPFAKHIVHGHTIATNPEFMPNRTGIDTGAYATGTLTALVLEGTEKRTLST
ncbi:MAG: metallophosphoesterase family protein [Pacificimonas sp.]